jgi:chromosome segregation ATPase
VSDYDPEADLDQGSSTGGVGGAAGGGSGGSSIVSGAGSTADSNAGGAHANLQRLVANYASRRAREVSEREGRVAAFAKLVGAQREEADREIAERDRNLATLQGIIDALKAHTKTEEDNVVRLETVVKDREATIADLTARHDTLGKQNNENEQMNRNHEKTIERLNKQSLDDMTAVIEKHRKDLEATRLQHETDMNTFAQKSVTAASDELKAENADLSRQVQALQTLVASNAASRAALAAADTAQKAMIKQLSQELAKEKAELKVYC